MTREQLETLFGNITVVQCIAWLIAAGVLIALVAKLWPKLKRFVATVDALSDLPEKIALIDEIHHEVRPNTGTSLNDSVRRTEAKVTFLEAQIGQTAGQLEEHLQQSTEVLQRLDLLEDTIQKTED